MVFGKHKSRLGSFRKPRAIPLPLSVDGDHSPPVSSVGSSSGGAIQCEERMNQSEASSPSISSRVIPEKPRGTSPRSPAITRLCTRPFDSPQSNHSIDKRNQPAYSTGWCVQRERGKWHDGESCSGNVESAKDRTCPIEGKR